MSLPIPTALHGVMALLSMSAPGLALPQVVYVVDDDGGIGVSFTELQPAVDVAGPLDRIDVRDGVYGGVTIDKAVTIMGLTGNAALVQVASVSIASTTAQESIVLSKFTAGQLRASGVEGTLLVDRVRLGTLRVSDCEDCRLQNSSLGAFSTASLQVETVSVTDSFLQLSSCAIVGRDGVSGIFVGSPGETAIRAAGSSEVLVANSSIRGGTGGVTSFGLSSQTMGEQGGAALSLSSSGSATVVCLDSGLHWRRPWCRERRQLGARAGDRGLRPAFVGDSLPWRHLRRAARALLCRSAHPGR